MPKLIPRMKYAFCGMSLEHGTKTVAYFNLFTYSVMAAIFIINARFDNFDLHDDTDVDPTSSPETIIWFRYPETWALGKNIKATFFLESTTVLQIVFSAFLLYGATVRHAKLLMSWILLQSGIIFHSQVIIILNFIVLFDEQTVGHWNLISFVLQEITTIAFQLYCMTIVYYYQEQIERIDNENEGRI